MSLVLYQHPLASFCHKVLIALYENRTPFESRMVDLADQESRSELFGYWPIGKIPVLRDEDRDRTIPETSIIIEYVEQHYPGTASLLPADFQAALEVRLWDRFFDLYVQTPMQKIVGDRLRPDGMKDPHGVAEAKSTLSTAYAMIEGQLNDRSWIAADDFTMADCAAAPALFYAETLVPFADDQPRLRHYYERLVDRPSYAKVLQEAAPYFKFYPYRARLPARFREESW